MGKEAPLGQLEACIPVMHAWVPETLALNAYWHLQTVSPHVRGLQTKWVEADVWRNLRLRLVAKL